MRSKIIRWAGLVILISSSLAGCTSTGYHKSNAAAVSMRDATKDVQAESQALDATLAAAKALVHDPGTDIRKPYKRFCASLQHLVATEKRAELTRKNMEKTNNDYLAAWDKQIAAIDFEHIRELSQARKTEVANRFEAVNQRYQESQEVMRPVISYFHDIQTALEADLTKGGLDSMKSIVQNAEENAVRVQTALGSLRSELADSGVHMSSIAYQDTPPPAE
jgi:hypothetical protein